MPNTHEFSCHGERAESNRPEHTQDASHVFNQITPEDRRSAYAQQELGLGRGAEHLPPLEIVNVDALNHRDVGMTPFVWSRGNEITRATLQRVIGDPRMANHVDAASEAVGLLRNFDAVANLNGNDGVTNISRDDLARLNRLPADSPLARRITNDMNAVPGNGLNEGLFDRRMGVMPEAVRQSDTIDNSALSSAMRSLARTPDGRQYILTAVHQDGNNVRVTLGDGQAVTTPRPTAAEMGVYSPDSRHGIWPNAMERAVGMAVHDDPLRPQWAVERFNGQQAVRALFGNRNIQTHVELGRVSDEAFHTTLTRASSNPMLMTADLGTNSGALADRIDGNGHRSLVQLQPRMTYEVERYDSATRNVYLRGRENESLRMPLRDFRRNFLAFDSVQRAR